MAQERTEDRGKLIEKEAERGKKFPAPLLCFVE
jgi:hypothetical protein